MNARSVARTAHEAVDSSRQHPLRGGCAVRTSRPSGPALLLVAGLCALWPADVFAEPVLLRPEQPIVAGAGALDPGDFAVPCVSDWNGDGKKDLLVGYRPADKIALYVNSGTDREPGFSGFANVKAAGVDIYQAGSSCGAPAPWVCDFDGDGRRDLLVGNGSNGRVFFYRNTNSDAQPMLASGVALLVGSSPLSVGSRATPFVHDWDEDGRGDLLVGDDLGQVHFFRNVGTSRSPTNAADVLLRSGGTNMNLGPRAVVRVYDWDGDGLKDVVGSSSTGVYWCRNQGSNPDPILASPVALKCPVSGSGAAPISASTRMRLDVVDWNNDGVTDLLLGNTDGRVFFYEGYHFAIAEVAPRPGGAMVLQWHSAPYLDYHVFSGDTPADMRCCVATNVPSGGNRTTWTNSTAGAVQFFRVQLAP